MIRPPVAKSRATRSELHGEAVTSVNISAVSGAAAEESCGSSRANAATSSGVAADATVPSMGEVLLVIRAGVTPR